MIASFFSQPQVFVTSEGELITTILAFVALGAIINATWVMFKHFNCHVNSPKFCWRFGHPVEGTSFRACHGHHPHRPDSGKISAKEILRRHEDSGA